MITEFLELRLLLAGDIYALANALGGTAVIQVDGSTGQESTVLSGLSGVSGSTSSEVTGLAVTPSGELAVAVESITSNYGSGTNGSETIATTITLYNTDGAAPQAVLAASINNAVAGPIAADALGNLYAIVNNNNDTQSLTEINGTTGVVAPDIISNLPYNSGGIAVSPDRDVVIASTQFGGCGGPSTEIITRYQLFGGEPGFQDSFPVGTNNSLAVDQNGNIYALAGDGQGSSTSSVVEINGAAGGAPTTILPNLVFSGGGQASSIALDPDGNLVVETSGGYITRYNPQTAQIVPFGAGNDILMTASIPNGAGGIAVGLWTRQLTFQDQPTDTPAGVPIDPGTGIQVSVEKPDGTIDTSDNSDVTLSIEDGPAGAVLGGTTTVAAVDGVVTFNDLTLNLAGSYTLQASDGSDADATSNTFNIGPIELQGSFTDGASSGPVNFGLAPTAAGQVFVPLLQVTGPVSYENDAIDASGTLESLVGNPAAPAAPYSFTGDFFIPDGSAATSSFSETDSNLQIAGLTTSLSSLTFANIGNDNQMDFTGGVILPDSLGGFNIPLPNNDPIVVDANGIGLTATVNPPDTTFMLGGALNVSATQMVLSYTTNDGYLKVQGDFKVMVGGEPKPFTLDLNLAGGNYFSYSPTQGLTLVGTLSYAGPPVPLFSDWVELDGASISINTSTSSGNGSLNLTVGEKSVAASLSILNGYFNSVSLTVSEINYPIAETGIFWQSISGSIQHLSPTDPYDEDITGSLGFSYGPKISGVTIPAVLGGGTFSGALVEADFSGSVQLDPDGKVDDISNEASVKVIGGLASGSAEFDCDLDENTFGLEGLSLTAFNGALTFQGAATIALGGPIIAYGIGSVHVPTSIPGIGGVQLASVSALMNLPATTDLSKDYFAVWGTINVPLLGPKSIGIKIDLAGDSPTLLNASNLPTIPPPPVDLRGVSEPQSPAADPAVSVMQGFTVSDGTPYIVLSASWADPTGSVPFQIIAPDGTEYTNTDSGDGAIAIVPSLTDATNLTIAVDAPAAGVWQFVLSDASSLGSVDFGGFAPIPGATAAVQVGPPSGTSVPINYQVTDPNPDASVALFYSPNASGFTGTLIASGLPAGTGQFQWNDSGLPVGGDYVYALVTDDQGVPLLAYASGPIVEGTGTESTSTTLSASSPGTTGPAQPLSFTATVSGGVPDGETVLLEDASNADIVVASGILRGGAATITIPANTLLVGTHNLIAVYEGDPIFSTSQSSTLVQTVVALPAYVTTSLGALCSYDPSNNSMILTSGMLTFTVDNPNGPLLNLTASGSGSQVIFQTSAHLAGLTLTGGAQAIVQSLGAARTHSNHSVLVIGTPGSANDPTLSIDSQSKLDLGDNDLILHTGSSDPTGASLYAEVEAMAALGRNPAGGVAGQPDGQWNGNGLSSSSAASADALAGYEKIGLAVVVNSTLLTGTLSSWQVGSFNESLGANDIIVKYDYLGDYALEGMVYQDDAGILQLEYDGGTNSGHTWATGSSLFDGLSDQTEAGLMQLQYGLGTGGNNGQQL